jgi:hypothetical protein
MPPATKHGVFTLASSLPAAVFDPLAAMGPEMRGQSAAAYPTGRDAERSELKRAFCSSLSPS